MFALHSLFFLLVSGVALGRPLARLPHDLWSDSSVRRVVPLASFGQTAFGQTTPSRTMPPGPGPNMQKILETEWGNAMTPNNPMTEVALAMTQHQVDRLRSQSVGAIFLKDKTKGWSDPNAYVKRHVNKEARDYYNHTWRKATPIFARTIPARNYTSNANASRVGMLWLGGENAARDTDFLLKNNITVRFVCKEDWGCRDDNRFEHRRIVVDRYFGNGWLGKPASGDISDLKNAVLEIDKMLAQGHNVLLYCRQGARRAASVAQSYLMSKCHLSARNCHQYLTSLRGIVEESLFHDGERLEREALIYDWFKGDTLMLPSALTEAEVRSIADGSKALQQEKMKHVQNKEKVHILQQTREVVHVNTANTYNVASGQNRPLARHNAASSSSTITIENAASGQTTQPEKPATDWDDKWPRPKAEGPVKVKPHLPQAKAPPPPFIRPERDVPAKAPPPLPAREAKPAPAKAPPPLLAKKSAPCAPKPKKAPNPKN